jgi:hypothetical protein
MILDLTLIDWLGALGSLMIAGAYLAVSMNWVRPERAAFNLLNLLGAAFILISLYERPNLGAIMIEVLWVCIAVFALARIWIRKRKES